MLIQRLCSALPVNYINDYYFAKYNRNGCKVVSLLLKLDLRDGYYDVVNHKYIHLGYVELKKPLTTYVDYDRMYLSNLKAKKLAQPYFKRFANRCKKEEYKIRQVEKIL